MPEWHARLVHDVRSVVQGDHFWERPLCQWTSQNACGCTLHLAILVEPYLQFILEGRKTVESRFSARRGAPYGIVQRGDIVLLKRSGGPVVGLAQIAYVWFYRLDPRSWDGIRNEFTEALCAQDPAFWHARRHASYATLMRLQHVRAITPVPCVKRDRRGWVVLQRPVHQMALLATRKPIVLAFAGSIASGKSTLSMGIAQTLGWPRVSFGDYVRHVVQGRGLECSREVLQEVGAALIEEQGWKAFCRAVIAQVEWEPGQSLVVDGIRHAEAVEVLRQLVAPSELLLVLIAVEESARRARLHQRSITNDETQQRFDVHSTEIQVRTLLPEMADFTVDGTRPVANLLQEIVHWVQQRASVVSL
jgi:dephospho-CoA kinase